MTRQVWKQNQRDFRLITNHNRKKKKPNERLAHSDRNKVWWSFTLLLGEIM